MPWQPTTKEEHHLYILWCHGQWRRIDLTCQLWHAGGDRCNCSFFPSTLPEDAYNNTAWHVYQNMWQHVKRFQIIIKWASTLVFALPLPCMELATCGSAMFLNVRLKQMFFGSGFQHSSKDNHRTTQRIVSMKTKLYDCACRPLEVIKSNCPKTGGFLNRAVSERVKCSVLQKCLAVD